MFTWRIKRLNTAKNNIKGLLTIFINTSNQIIGKLSNHFIAINKIISR